jgi:hypothetical protein
MLKVAPAALALMIAAAALAAAGSAAAGTPLVKGSSGPLKATLAPSSHSPKINTKWPITVTATLNGKPAHASAIYQFLVDGAPVGPTEYPFNNKHYTFTGHFSDSLVFPAASVGEPITLSVVIKDAGHTVPLNWAISAHT